MRKNGCEFCNQKPVFSQGKYREFESRIRLATGPWVRMYIGADENGRVVMRAYTDGSSGNYYPKYCPECGRKLQ